MKPGRAAVLVAATYAGSVLLSLGLLVAGAVAASGLGASGAESILLLVLGLTALGFLCGTILVFVVMGRAGLSGIARLLAVVGYGALCAATLGGLFLIGAIAFNR